MDLSSGLGGGGETFRAHAGLVTAQVIFAGYHVLTKVALEAGMNQVVFCAIRDLIATSILAPVAFFSERIRPPLTFNLLVSFAFLGFVGIFVNQLLVLIGLSFTNPTSAAATQPAIPVFTFILAAIMGIETVNIYTNEGRFKVIGSLVCVSGAVFMVFYKGPSILGDGSLVLAGQSPMNLTSHPGHLGWLASPLLQAGLEPWHIGIMCLITNCFCMGVYLTFQVPVLKKYPASLSLTAFSYFFGALFVGVTGFFASSSKDWFLTQPEIIAILYAAVCHSALGYALMNWSNKIIGPVMVSLYNPLQPAIAAFLSTIFLGSPIVLGSIIGGFLIISGLYIVTWARYTESERHVLVSYLNSDDIEPLLHDDPSLLQKAYISAGSSATP